MGAVGGDPESAPLIFTADVEDYFQAESLRGCCPRERWAEFEDRTEQNTECLLEILERRGIQGTFFVLGWTAERHPALVRRIAAAGHEVASHGYFHELITRQSPGQFREDVRKARGILQDLSGQPVGGYRAPSYTVMKATWWALDVLAEEGHEYDSSVFPIKRRKYGVPGAPGRPHIVPTASGGIRELPLPAVGAGPFRLPATGGAYMRLLPLGFQKWAVGRMLRQGRPVILNVHPWELDPGQPRFPVGWRTRITHYHNLNRTQGRLEEILDRFPVRPLSTILPA